ncbi:MAG: MotA/TolQ/ExbB proton channel family protein, partial [Deltaproteobacteria bacterium]|nr:MotA/TolQ/ExbB proton channel family protein [Deltaproteobacteria bacterium]
IGILGAVLGLIHVMENLADPSKLGAGIAVAFVATVYGVGSANLLWLPIAGKMKFKIKEESLMKEMIVEGLISLSEGENPRRVEEKLGGFLRESEKKKQQKSS